MDSEPNWGHTNIKGADRGENDNFRDWTSKDAQRLVFWSQEKILSKKKRAFCYKDIGKRTEKHALDFSRYHLRPCQGNFDWVLRGLG